MPDDIRPQPPGLTVAEALSRLPLETPERSAWPVLAARIHATTDRPRGPRWPFALAAAAAAVLALALVLPLRLAGPGGSDAAPQGAADATALQALMQESAQLEGLLATISGAESGSANALLLGLAFEERLRDIDAALADPALADDAEALLWQRRVALLRDYASLRGTEQWVAMQGGHFEGDLVATY
ncbi:hypothetical protein [Arenimonas sp.]|uniref:hypothetical protein n=1 Tax=Arenimonas sp. TaxID=1872635 RepID=UPI0025F3A891|nr:hypothetical protein [Arenimonas sp.]